MKLGFLVRSLGSLGLGGGIGVGSVALYKNSVPVTWRELLQREGVYLIEEDGDYKGIFYDQKTRMQEVDSLKSVAEVNSGYSAIKNWCTSELEKTSSTEGDFQKTKQKIIDLCSQSGILTVKGRVASSNKISWIEDSNDDKDSKYKVIFAVYKYYPEFLEWLNEGKGEDEKITKTSEADDKYSELQKKCKEVVQKAYPSASDDQIYNYSVWWCQPLSYSDVEGRIKSIDSSWEQATEWNDVYEMWKGTSQVVEKIKGTSSDEPDKNKFSEWCTEKLKKKLSDKGVYQDDYLIAKSVCRKISK